MASKPRTFIVHELNVPVSLQQWCRSRRRTGERRSVHAPRYAVTSSRARSPVSSGGDTSDTTSSSLCFPNVGDLRQRQEGVPAVGVHPQVAAASLTNGHQLAVVDAGAVSHRHVHAMALELLQMYAVSRCHPTLRRLLSLAQCFGAVRRGLDRNGPNGLRGLAQMGYLVE